MQSLLLLGRQPELGLAELESLYGAAVLRPVGTQAVVLDIDPCLLAFDRLGGSLKFAKVLTTLATTSWKEIEKFVVSVAAEHSKQMPAGKMRLGLSVVGLNVPIKQLLATGLVIKKAVSKTGRSVRFIPNKTPELNSAQVIHNQLTGPTGWELVFVRDGEQTIIAQTVKVQDIEAYTRRDQLRPMRDAKVGMLPPKLAQIIINLSVGLLPTDKLESICDIPAGTPIPPKLLDQTVLDPFCGSGVILQESLLMGYHSYGSDLDARMVDYSKANLAWLANGSQLAAGSRLEVGDATKHTWQQPIDFIAAETYLGRPFTRMPDNEILAQTVTECNLIIKKFLQAIHSQLKSGSRLCLAVPAWQLHPGQFKRLPLIDQMSELGYNQVSFEHPGATDLLYYRADQIVARELIVITRK